MNRHTGLGASLLIAITLAAYLPAINGGFIWDDDDYVTENATLRSLEGLKSIWLDPSATPQYYPLVHSSFWIEYQLWGLHPLGYHLVNVLIHAINAILLWRILKWFGVPGAWFAALVFAIHPVHVESVAWITERKNVLSGMFYLSAALCFLRYWDFTKSRDTTNRCSSVEHPEADASVASNPETELADDTVDQVDRRWYFAAFACFVGALLCKTVVATFPAAMLVMIWWQRGRITGRNVVTLLPFFVLGISLGLLTVWLEKTQVGASGMDWDLSFFERCLVAGRAMWFYAGKLIWPVPLVFTYYRWTIDGGQLWQVAFPATALAVMGCLAAMRGRVGRGPLAAVLFFAGSLFPALGFFDVYPMRFSFVADHFQYLASIGIIALIVASGKTALDRLFAASILPPRVIAAAVTVLLVSLTWQQGRIYKDVETLWRDTLAKNPASFLAHNNLGAIMNRRREFVAAESHLRRALELKPDFVDAILNLGKAREGQKDFNEALELYLEATRLRPDLALGWNGLGATYGMLGELEASEKHLLKAVELDPEYALARSNLAALYFRQGKLGDAASGFRAAVRLDPTLVEARENLARVLMSQQQTGDAKTVLKEILELQPTNISALLNLGVIAAGENRHRSAIGYFEAVLKVDPRHLAATYNAAAMHETLGNQAESERYFRNYDLLRAADR